MNRRHLAFVLSVLCVLCILLPGCCTLSARERFQVATWQKNHPNIWDHDFKLPT